jgi:AcrR family transcriptional regulator
MWHDGLMPDLTRSWAGTTLAERRTERRAALMSSALALISEHGTAAVTTKAVCDRAGIIERYLYESFASRAELLRTVFDECLQRGSAATLAGFAKDPNAPRAVRARDSINAVLDLTDQEPGIVRLLFVDAAVDPALREQYNALQTNLETLCRKLLDEAAVPLPDEDERMVITTILVGAAKSLLTACASRRLTVERETIVNTMVRTAQSLLFPVAAEQR